MTTGFKLDYIRVRMDTLLEQHAIREFDALALSGNWQPTRPQFGYTVGLIDLIYGAKVFAGASVAMGVLIELSGKALDQYASVSFMEREQLEKRFVQTGTARRLDFTFDVGSAFTVTQLHEAFLSGAADTPAHNIMLIKATRGGKGSTLYIGGRSSDRYIRVYDKGAQLGGNEDENIRVELETKGDVAREYGKMIIAGTRAIDIGSTAIKKSIAWQPLHDAISGAKVELGSMPRTEGNTTKWLMDTVAPTLKRMTAEPGFLAFFAEFALAAGINSEILKDTIERLDE